MENATVPTWEASKENVLPVKKGRSAKGLSEKLSEPILHNLANEQEQTFEMALKDISEPAQKLEMYTKFLKWSREAFPSATEKSMQILERCTRELMVFEEMKNEPKYVMLWIDYADMVRTPGEVFTFMQVNKIGERVALFWVAWAWVAEKASNYKLTDQVFQKGIRRNAEPKELLAQRYKQYMRRMARLYLNSTSDAEDGTVAGLYTESADRNSVVDNAITQRAMEWVRSAVTANPAASTASTGTSVSGERVALNTLSGSNNITVATAAPVQSAGVNSSARRPTSRPTTTTTSSSRANNPVSAGTGSSNVGFEIFSDIPVPGSSRSGVSRSTIAPHLYEAENDSASATATSTTGAPTNKKHEPTWKNLPTEAVRRKENNAPVTKWSDGPLFPGASGTTSAAVSAPAAAAVLTIPIYIDEEFQNTPDNNTVPHVAPANVLSVRRQLDTVEGIIKNPLAKHSAQTSAPEKAPVTLEPSAAVARVKPVLGEVKADKIPLSTATEEARPKVKPVLGGAEVKAADVELPVFTSAPHPAVVAPKISKGLSITTSVCSGKAQPSNAGGGKASNGLGFDIYTESPPKTTAMAAAAFSIYESPSASAKSHTSAKVSTKVSAKPSLSATGGMGFSVYESPARASAATTRKALGGVPTSMGFSIFTDEPAVAKPTAAATTTAAPVFHIYESPVQPSKHIATSTATTTATAAMPANKSSTSSMAFDIYESPVKPTAAPTVATNTSRAPVFDIFVDDSCVLPNPTTTTTTATAAPTTHPSTPPAATTSTTTNATSEEDELHHLLDNVLQMDAEDGTINTRLARRDIDLMFCSPTIHKQPSHYTTTTAAKSNNHHNNVSVIHDENENVRTIHNVRTPGPVLEEPDFDEFDNDYAAENSTYNDVFRSNSGDNIVYPVCSNAKHKPFGVYMDTLSAVKDLSAIKESSQEFSMCGLMETPGHTGTLGFGAHPRMHASSNSNNHRASYSMMGGLMDFDTSHSRESIGSVHPPTNPTNNTNNVSTLGFAIFDDTAATQNNNNNNNTGSNNGTNKRKGLSEPAAAAKPYYGV